MRTPRLAEKQKNAELHANADLVAVDDTGGGAAGDRGVVFLEAQAASGRSAEHVSLAQVDRGLARQLDLAAVAEQFAFVAAIIADFAFGPGLVPAELAGDEAGRQRFIFLVDNSASMSATDRQAYAAGEAKREGQRIDTRMKSGEVAMIISFADSARVERAIPTIGACSIARLEGIRPSEPGHFALGGVEIGRGAGQSGPQRREDILTCRWPRRCRPRCIFFRDGKFPPVTGFQLGNLEPKFIPIGSPEAKNMGILAFSASGTKPGPTVSRPLPGWRISARRT